MSVTISPSLSCAGNPAPMTNDAPEPVIGHGPEFPAFGPRSRAAPGSPVEPWCLRSPLPDLRGNQPST